MSDLSTRLAAFDKSLASFKAESNPSWQTGQMFNALLEMAKQEHPDDSMIKAIDPARRGVTVPGSAGKEISTMDAGSMRAAISQILSVVGRRGPAIA